MARCEQTRLVRLAVAQVLTQRDASGDAGQFFLEARDRVYVKDPDHQYFLEYKPDVGSVDDIYIRVNSNQFIQAISSNVDSQVDEALVEFGRAFAGFRQAGLLGKGERASVATGVAPQMLGAYFVDLADPADVARVEEQINDRVIGYIDQALKICARNRELQSPGCKRFEYLASDFNEAFKGRFIRIGVDRPEVTAQALPADCELGVCIRMNQPYSFTLSVGDGSEDSAIVQLPNLSPISVIDIGRAVFVQKITELRFDAHGFLVEADIQKQSELLEAAKLPLEIL